jgi:hypothetical protein
MWIAWDACSGCWIGWISGRSGRTRSFSPRCEPAGVAWEPSSWWTLGYSSCRPAHPALTDTSAPPVILTNTWNLSHTYICKEYQPASQIGIIMMTEQFKIKAPPTKVQHNCKICWEKYIFNTKKNMHSTVILIIPHIRNRTGIYCLQIYPTTLVQRENLTRGIFWLIINYCMCCGLVMLNC